MSPPLQDDGVGQNETTLESAFVEYSNSDVNSMELLYTLNRSLHQERITRVPSHWNKAIIMCYSAHRIKRFWGLSQVSCYSTIYN